MIPLSLLLIYARLPGQGRELDVFAAASLKESFEAIAKRFEAANPGVTVRLEFGGSQDLAAQMNQGAPADVFASASPKNLEQVACDPTSRRVFALNRLVVISPATATRAPGLRDLSGVNNIVLAAPAVPAGGYARKAFEAAAKKYGAPWLTAVNSHVVSEENDVRAVLTKVELGEADAGVVYSSDAMAGKEKVRAVAIPEEFQPRIAYPIAVLKSSRLAREAMQFIHAVLSKDGQAELTKRGFIPAPVK